MGASLLAPAKSIYCRLLQISTLRASYPVEHSFSMLLIDLLMAKSLLNSDH